MESLEKSITEKKLAIKDSQALIKKYEEQQMNVRNNREYDSLTKEVEYQGLEIQLAEKRIREFRHSWMHIKHWWIRPRLNYRTGSMTWKPRKLNWKISLKKPRRKSRIWYIVPKNTRVSLKTGLFWLYQRIRKNARNGLAVVHVERDACGGCFNKIPPQHQLEIRMHKKIIVCEYCGRILVDDAIAKAVQGI